MFENKVKPDLVTFGIKEKFNYQLRLSDFT